MNYTVRVGSPEKVFDSETQSTVMRVPFHVYVPVTDEQGNERLNNHQTVWHVFPLTATADELRSEAAKMQDVMNEELEVSQKTAEQSLADATIAELSAEQVEPSDQPLEQPINQ